MLGALIQHPTSLAVAIIVMALLNFGLGTLALRADSRQRIFERAASIQAVASRSPAQFALPFIIAVAMAALTLLLDAYSREAIGGGYLVMQLATLILNLDAWLRARVALIEGIADGRVVLSAQYQHRNLAAKIVAVAVFTELVAVAFGSLAFATGGAFLFATAAGWYRRAIQASRQVAAGEA